MVLLGIVLLGAGAGLLIAGAAIAVGGAGGGAVLVVAVVAIVALAALALLAVITRATLRVGRARAKTGAEALVGHVGVVRRAPAPLGQVFVDGALWQAKPCLQDELVVGDPVVVDHVRGMVLSVRRAEEWELEP
jgi:membrane protein implicated in regulation of membrane protease activity